MSSGSISRASSRLSIGTPWRIGKARWAATETSSVPIGGQRQPRLGQRADQHFERLDVDHVARVGRLGRIVRRAQFSVAVPLPPPGHLELGHGDQRFGARLERVGFEQRLLFGGAIGRDHAAEIDEVGRAGLFDLVPVEVEIAELGIVAHHLEEARAIDRFLAELRGRNRRRNRVGAIMACRNGVIVGSSLVSSKRQTPFENDEIAALLHFLEMRDAADGADLLQRRAALGAFLDRVLGAGSARSAGRRAAPRRPFRGSAARRY